jgi:gliding motility-associated-like protein
MHIRKFLAIILSMISAKAYCQQQDVQVHLNSHLLPGKTILKVKRDFRDPYLWVLAKNNEVYRVNSLTLAIDDYTAQFSAYSNLQFIDIAGRSKDTVFIATQSTNVIQYKSGSMRLIGTADNIPGLVNSVGIDRGNYPTNNNSQILIIGADGGFCKYNMDTEQPVGVLNRGAISKVFEATYRKEMYQDSTFDYDNYDTQDTVKFLPVVYENWQNGLVIGFLWEGGNEFGYHLNTAYYVSSDVQEIGDGVDLDELFWGSSRGMFQVNSNWSSTPVQTASGHYLNGINVNKITSIYGLVAFGDNSTQGNPGIIKENLLVGTDAGLYFSSSLYDRFYAAGGFVDRIRTFSMFHDDELGNIKVNDICVNASSTTAPICEDGVWLACDDGLYLVKPDYAVYLNNHSYQTASFKGQAGNVSQTNICSGSSVTAIVGNTIYPQITVQWYKDGRELPAQSLDSLVINNAGEYYAVLYDPCGNIHLESNHLTVQVISGPVFSFNYPNKIQHCDNNPVALQTDNNPAYHYRWYTNGILNGDTTCNFTVTQTGKYKVEVSACTNSWVPSKEVEVDLISLPVPVITADKAAYCIGDAAVFTVNTPIDPGYTINWYQDNVLLSANTNQTSFSTTTAGSYTVSVINNQVNTDGTTCTQTSTAQAVQFSPPPAVSIQKIVRTTLCDGQTVDLKVSYGSGTVKWSTGETSDQISVSTSGNYKAMVTTAAVCEAGASIDVTFFPNPILSIPDAGVCLSSHKTATLTAPAGLASYTWNGQPGTETYVADHPQTVTLAVTDANGCQATQEIHITDECPDVKIPNAFTPNGDGINDTWKIAGLEYDQTVLVRIFTRYGQQVYESKGYGTPWNGEYQGKKLPAGVYYYIINAKNGTQTYSGSLTILY